MHGLLKRFYSSLLNWGDRRRPDPSLVQAPLRRSPPEQRGLNGPFCLIRTVAPMLNLRLNSFHHTVWQQG